MCVEGGEGGCLVIFGCVHVVFVLVCSFPLYLWFASFALYINQSFAGSYSCMSNECFIVNIFCLL